MPEPTDDQVDSYLDRQIGAYGGQGFGNDDIGIRLKQRFPQYSSRIDQRLAARSAQAQTAAGGGGFTLGGLGASVASGATSGYLASRFVPGPYAKATLVGLGAAGGALSYGAEQLDPSKWWLGPALGTVLGGVGGGARAAGQAAESALVRSLAFGEATRSAVKFLFPNVGEHILTGLETVARGLPIGAGMIRNPSNLLFPLAGGMGGVAGLPAARVDAPQVGTGLSGLAPFTPQSLGGMTSIPPADQP